MADLRDVLLVDGYNMIGAWPDLASLSQIDMDEARDRLLERLADYQAFTGRRVIAVFDAYRVPGKGKSFKQGKVEVYFTKEKETADEAIERFAGQLGGKRRLVYVATNDFVEQSVAFAQGALRVPALELLVDVEQSEREIGKRIAEQARLGSRNTLDGKLTPEQLKLFERWRRQ
ncbi:NYN domain-containing protein [Saccharibacillus alkalitolerans]|uniref:NYN domain-containing protein n=1 Tax=Saccharibacillus alkalitolerans TaxID=2705290 RepID=A0ABX0FD02_9BACL|nr:NYN domain-containing protein [Saccharibacillus alkalitolerans]NGZ78094.1 NYN domain-containing protein [Saccharibacillus alkalitolerans]